jgi:hypothetical protein
MSQKRWFYAILLAAAAASANAAAGSHTDNGIDLRITPRSSGGMVVGIEIEETVRQGVLPAGAVVLRMPIVITLEPGALADPRTLTVRDDRGLVPLSIADDPPDPSNFHQDRRWLAQRPTRGSLVIRYTATPRLITATTRAGPLVDVRTEGTGVYGSMITLLALPENSWPRAVSLHWDLHELPSGSRAGTSLGEGDRSATLRRDQLEGIFFMAGPLHSIPADGQGDFVVYWITPPAWDLQGAADWTHRAYQYFGDFWNIRGQPFRIFMRTTQRFQGGGGGGYNSFIFGNVEGDRRDPIEVRELMAHEASHNFVGHTSGDSEAGGQWYSEGADVYYTNVLTYRAGLVSLDRFAENMNTLVAEYYENPLSHLSNAEVTRQFFSSHDAEVVSYQRGPLYFALVDSKLRSASGGTRRVDELVRPMVEASRSGGGATEERWMALLRSALGDAGVTEFKGMMEGQPLNLPENLLGPCFRREAMVYRQYRPGFRILTDRGGVPRVARLQQGSAAARVGVREGDEVLDPDLKPTDQALAGLPVTLHLRRDEKNLSLALTDAWGPQVSGWRYVRTGVPREACGI